MLSSTFNNYPVHLIQTVEELESLKSKFSPKVMVGLDTETRGLMYKEEQVVGVCVSGGTDYTPNGYAGYYIPIRHTLPGVNLPVDKVLEFTQFLIDNYQTVFWNRNFDLMMLQFEGIKVPFVGGMHDGQCMAYMVLNDPYPALKDYATRFLKWDMIEFAQNNADQGNFGSTDPNFSYIYAAGDPLTTVILTRKIWNDYPYVRKVYKIDNLVLEAVRRMTQTPIQLDYDFLEKTRVETEARLKSIQAQIYQISGVYGFNIDSAKEKADVLSRFVTLTEKTASGKFKTDADALAKLDHPLAKLMIEYSETRVFLRSFVEKMCSYKGRVVRANYNTVNVPSGRLSSGGSKGNDYFVPQNLQNVPKEEERLYLQHHPDMGYTLSRDESTAVRDKDGNPVKVKTKTGLHEAFITDGPEWMWFTADYSGQEMRLTANFSKEPGLVDPLKSGADIHMHVAKLMFGFEDPDHRTRVKTVNFAKLYGAEDYTIGQRLGIPREEAKVLCDTYDRTLSKLTAWKKEVVKTAKKRGYALTYFGRPVYLLKFFNSSDRSKRSYAERLAVNSTVQGCIPPDLFIPSQDGLTFESIRHHIGKKVTLSEVAEGKHDGVFTYRGVTPLEEIWFESGDFAVVSYNHKFQQYNSEFLLNLDQCWIDPVRLEQPQKKVKLGKAIFRTLGYALHPRRTLPTMSSLFVRVAQLKPVPAESTQIASCLFSAWIRGEVLKTQSMYAAFTFRSLVDLYGYNLVRVGDGEYKLRWKRKKFSKAVGMRKSGSTNVVSPNMVSGYQTYPLAGFIHKNTGGDLARIILIKFEKLRDTNPEWRDNTKFCVTVHDEVNFQVHKDYLYKAWKIIMGVMNFHPDNFEVPIEAEPGVGTGWGTCCDFDCVSLDNRIVPKGLDPENLPEDEANYLIDIIKNCDIKDLPNRLKKYHE